MDTVPFSEARAHLAKLLNIVAYGGERVILTRQGEKIAAIVSIDDLDLIEAIEDTIDVDILKMIKTKKKRIDIMNGVIDGIRGRNAMH